MYNIIHYPIYPISLILLLLLSIHQVTLLIVIIVYTYMPLLSTLDKKKIQTVAYQRLKSVQTKKQQQQAPPVTYKYCRCIREPKVRSCVELCTAETGRRRAEDIYTQRSCIHDGNEMLLTGISWILVLIPFSSANRGVTVNCKGDSTKLSCLDKNHIEGNEINALWKKHSGEKVIWKYNGDSKRGDTFTNRTVQLNDDLSLSISECDQSDEGIYILCINGKPNCEVSLYIKDSKLCKQKATTAQSAKSTAFPIWAKQAVTDENPTIPTNIYTRWVIYACSSSVVLVVISLCISVLLKFSSKEKTSKNDKSGSKLLHSDIQKNYADV
ncbi:uncharacterized protein LOC122329927 [Puntigrus tetrazona]|uniref:uncharacterized protein LOC122329927 n=1 Tax=Puntigrus tetrazona TaxID=1606681 RepID=UPI001C8932E2|nr:uncharacterized protein LOC122329927 [Puntigrus tetrazona]XP_043082558.1 uncharacterized protein LOC122329927 [Puntigrus tetrazona]